ncbi:GspH/FimT family protein [Microbulbifer sp.]|uniref:GspH/FimT family protein n=1 Tax=Microbulbifer sp. TaxID=1908541 RepID=UPI002587108A|nr:GspH/FimT family protein [Microbulbifer sp.]
MHARGLSLLELLITLSILSILMAVAIPSFNRQIEANQTRAATEQFLQAIQLTRNKAITTNRRVTMRNPGRWDAGWEIFYDKDFDGVRDADEKAITSSGALDGIEISANGQLTSYVSFIGSGQGRTAGTLNGGSLGIGSFTICPANGGDGYKLLLAGGGRLRQEKLSAEDCQDSNSP